MSFISKIKHFKIFTLLLSLIILNNCQLKDPIKGHGINFLKNRSDKIVINKSNKNDIIKNLGNPHTKSISDENLWFYFDRKISTGSIVHMKKNKLIENNVLVIEFNKYGVVINKKLLTKNDMKEIVYSTNKTENPVTEQSFVTRFLQSVKQKMYGKRKF